MGTLEKVGCKVKCAEKGCYSDPLPVRDMHITIPAGETSGAGSASGLDAHYCVSGIRSEALQMRIKLRIYRYNYGIDMRLG